MNANPIMVATFPRAILHMDGDAFFTSVEQALDPTLRGKPVVTGKERGIIACASYEAKALGIKRGIPFSDARKLCPHLIVLPSDYESYGLYSERMFAIIRKYTPVVEEYSVDEAFADLTGVRRIFRTSYEDSARRIQEDVHRELGITVSVGVSLSKALAKLCSKFRKPAGLTAVPGKFIHILLQNTPLSTVWGFGPSTVSLLEKHGLRTAYDYVQRPERWARQLLGKPGWELWNELRGHAVWKVTDEPKETYATIMKSKTFTPATNDRSFIYAKLIRNVEAAFMKARRYKLRPRALGVVLRRHDFQHDGLEVKLNRPSSSTQEVIPLIRKLFDKIFEPSARYRATMIVLGLLEDDQVEQYELFEDRLKIETLRNVTGAVDAVNRRFGRHTLCAGTGLFLSQGHEDQRAASHPRQAEPWPGETRQRRLAIPHADIRI